MTGSPREVVLGLPAGEAAALVWGPDDGPLAVLLHGFPDSPWTWRTVAPVLAEHGWRVVAPWTRGYAPTFVPADGSYHVGALMADAVAVHRVMGGGDDSVLVGHDWGALTANALGAHEDSPFGRVVSMAVPPLDAIRPRLDPLLLGQVRRSWYIGFAQLPVVPERALDRLVPRLWRDWSPGYDASDDLPHAMAAIRGRESAVLGYYRAMARPFLPPPPAYRSWHRSWRSTPVVPTLYLHGADDGCLSPALTAGVSERLPAGSAAHLVDRAGHFLQLEQPDAVAALVLDFLGGSSR